MKWITITLSLLAALTATQGAAQAPTRYELDVKDFSELKVTDGINVDYVCSPDSAGKAVFFATPDVASQILFVPNKQKLEIQLSDDEKTTRGNLPRVRVYSNILTFVENSGDSMLRVLNVNPCPKFRARVIGNGRIVVRDIKATQVDASLDTGKGSLVIRGTAETANLSCTGTGSITADDLVAETVKCKSFGTGTIGCAPTKNLSVMGMSGTIYYRGAPAIKNRSLGVKVLPLDAAQPEGDK